MALARENGLQRIRDLQKSLESKGTHPQIIAIMIEDATIAVEGGYLNNQLVKISELLESYRKSIAIIRLLESETYTLAANSIRADYDQLFYDAEHLPLKQFLSTVADSRLEKINVQVRKLIDIRNEILEKQKALQSLTIYDQILSEIHKFIAEKKKRFTGNNHGHDHEVLSKLEQLEKNYHIVQSDLSNFKKQHALYLSIQEIRNETHDAILKQQKQAEKMVSLKFLELQKSLQKPGLMMHRVSVPQLESIGLNPNVEILFEYKESEPQKMKAEFDAALQQTVSNLHRVFSIGTPNNFDVAIPNTEKNIKDFSDEANILLNTVIADISKKMAGISLLEKKHDLDPREIRAAMDALKADVDKAKESISKLGNKSDTVGDEIGLIKPPLQNIIAQLDTEDKKPAPGPDLGEMYKSAIKARKDLFTAKLNAFQPSVDVYNATLDIFEDQIQPVYKQASTYLKALREKFTPQVSKQNISKASAPMPIPGRPQPLSNARPGIQPWTPQIDSDFSGMQEERLDGLMDDLSGLEHMLSSSVSLGSTPPSAPSTRSSFDSVGSSFPSPSLSRSVSSSSSDEEDAKHEGRKGAAAARSKPAGYSSASSVMFQSPPAYNPATRAPGYNPSANDPTRQRDGRGGPGGV